MNELDDGVEPGHDDVALPEGGRLVGDRALETIRLDAVEVGGAAKGIVGGGEGVERSGLLGKRHLEALQVGAELNHRLLTLRNPGSS